MVVACLFAGVGAWAGEFIQYTGNASPYAAEIFGEGSAEIEVTYPPTSATDTTPKSPTITLVFNTNTDVPNLDLDGDGTANTAVTGVAAPENTTEPGAATDEGTITFALENAVFAKTVVLADLVAGAGIVSLESGGDAGDSEVTFRISGAITDNTVFTFTLPKLKGIMGTVLATATTVARVGSTGFPTGPVTKFVCVTAANPSSPAVVVGDLINAKLNDDNTISGKVAQTDDVTAAGTAASAKICSDLVDTDDTTPAKVVLVTKDAVKLETVAPADPTMVQRVDIDIDERTMLKGQEMTKLIGLKLTTNGSLYQSDGTRVGSELSGDVTVTVTGTRELFAPDDMVIVKSGEKALERTSTKNLDIEDTTGQFVGSALPVIFQQACTVHRHTLYAWAARTRSLMNPKSRSTLQLTLLEIRPRMRKPKVR